MLKQVIIEFGKQLGFKNLRLNEHNVVHLSIENMGELYLERVSDHLVIYLVNKIPSNEVKVLEKALTLCHYKQKNPQPVSVALLNDNELFFLARLKRVNVNEINIEKTINLLNKLQNSIKAHAN